MSRNPLKSIVGADRDAYFWIKKKLSLSEYQMGALVWFSALIIGILLGIWIGWINIALNDQECLLAANESPLPRRGTEKGSSGINKIDLHSGKTGLPVYLKSLASWLSSCAHDSEPNFPCHCSITYCDASLGPWCKANFAGLRRYSHTTNARKSWDQWRDSHVLSEFPYLAR